MAFIEQRLGSRKAISISAVALVHLAIGYAFITGLAGDFVRTEVFGPTETYNVPLPKPPHKPPPHIDRQTTRKIDDPLPIVKPTGLGKPPIELPTGGAAIDIKPFFPVDPQPQTASLSRALQPGKGHDSWVTPDDYPPSAIRRGEEGPVRIAVRVGTDGRVLSCEITASSGSSDLDQAACRYYSKRARFTPALSADGTPVESSYADRIVWRLPEQ